LKFISVVSLQEYKRINKDTTQHIFFLIKKYISNKLW